MKGQPQLNGEPQSWIIFKEILNLLEIKLQMF